MGHQGKACKGGPQDAYRCLLTCGVFGAQPRKCETHNGDARENLLNGILMRAMESHHDACDGMRCIVDCAKELDCFDGEVKAYCSRLSRGPAGHGHCDVHCGEEEMADKDDDLAPKKILDNSSHEIHQ